MSRQLSSEDALRLNVLLAQDPCALRIDESKMRVLALVDGHETQFELNPNCAEDTYLKILRETLSGHILGSPRAYPVYLKRWTRMGQERHQHSLRKLLLLGEPEAVVAVAHANNLSLEVARYVWWIEPSAECARQMLRHPHIAQSDFANELVAFLMEFLPFEETSHAMIGSLAAVLQSKLLSDVEQRKLWKQAKRKGLYYVGFLRGAPETSQAGAQAHPQYASFKNDLQGLDAEHPCRHLLKLFSAGGQNFITTAALALRKPSDQDVVIELFGAIHQYVTQHLGFPEAYCHAPRTLQELESFVANYTEQWFSQTMNRERVADWSAVLALTQVHVSLLDPVFGLTDAVGSVMRKRIEPISQPLMCWFNQLCPGLDGQV